MSLKSAIIDYGALENLQSREGIEGFLIGANVGNKAFITYCFPLKEPWNLTSMDVLSSGKTLHETLMKKCIKLIKQTKYLLYGGLDFLGFYINCNSKDLKTYETKLVNPLSNRLHQKKFIELINIYHILDTQNSLVFHSKDSNSEKIDQKPQNVFDLFITTSTKIYVSLKKIYKADEFLEITEKLIEERVKQMENNSIISLDNVLIMNEQESIDYYMKNKNPNGNFEFHLELSEAINLNQEENVVINGEFLIKGFIHKKNTIAECKKILIEDLRNNLKRRLKFLPTHEDFEDLLDKQIKISGIFPIPSRDCIELKKHQEFYNYRCFTDKGFFDFLLDNFLLNVNDLSFVTQEKPDYQEKLWCEYNKLYQQLLNSKPKQNISKPSISESQSSLPTQEILKKKSESIENIKSRSQIHPEIPSKIEKPLPEVKEKKVEVQSDSLKYLILILIVILLIILRLILN